MVLVPVVRSRAVGDYVQATCPDPACAAHVEYLPLPAQDDPSQCLVECASCATRWAVEVKRKPRSPFLPVEVLHEIVSLRAGDYQSLLAFALVSKFWNAVATPLLYADLHGTWDSRRLKLFRTLDSHPHLAAHVRAVDMYYPRLLQWTERTREDKDIDDDTYERLWDDRNNALPEAEQQPDVERHDPVLLALVARLATKRYLARAAADGAADWMDGSDAGDGPRCEGASRLLELLARCSLLHSLRLDTFDFGFGEALPAHLDARLPAALPSITYFKLSCMRGRMTSEREARAAVSPSTVTLGLFLRRLPALKHLSLDDIGHEDLPPEILHLPHLVSLDIYTLKRPENARSVLPSTVEAFHALGPSLRFLSLYTVDFTLEDELARLLSTATHLRAFSLRTRSTWLTHLNPHAQPVASLSPALLAYLAASTTLKHLRLPCIVTPPLVNALPASLVTLRANFREDGGFTSAPLPDIMRLVLDRPGAPLLRKVTLAEGGILGATTLPEQFASFFREKDLLVGRRSPYSMRRTSLPVVDEAERAGLEFLVPHPFPYHGRLPYIRTRMP